MDVASVGQSVISHAVRRRMAACKLSEPDAYLERLQGSEVELQQLIEAVVVGETWFFRDREAFAALVQWMTNEWLPTHATGQLRILSAPCASGEEPYSIAMALLDAGLPAPRFRIDAVDISTPALAQARCAVYGKNAFRGRDLDFRERYFSLTAEGYVLAEPVRTRVHFKQANLLAADFLTDMAGYDVICCRNLLIYFDESTQDRLLKTLGRLLASDGILFVGPAETFLTRSRGFSSADYALAFAYRKTSAKPHEEPSQWVQPPTKTKATSRAKPARKTADKPQPGKPSAPKPKPIVDLETAGHLANAGRLAEAQEVCEAYLREQGASAAGYYLLGSIRDAMGDERATDCYRKVIYLEPNHPEALMHLALLATKQGDLAGARRYQMRARRIEEDAAK